MSLNQDFPSLDGIDPSWADVTVKTAKSDGPILPMKAIKSITSGCSLEIGQRRGASGGRVMARTTGSESAEAEMEVYYPLFRDWLVELGKGAPTRGNQIVIGTVHFGISYQFSVPGDSRIYEVRIKGCRYAGRTIAVNDGSTDAVSVPVKLNPMQVVDVIDGKEYVLL